MVVLQEDPGEWPKQHFAFTVKNSELDRAISILKEKDVKVFGPVFQDWMAGRSVYFEDPDGHGLELFASSERKESRALDSACLENNSMILEISE